MKIIYRAEDGKEFEKKTDCLLYERTLNLYYENTIQKIKYVVILQMHYQSMR